ncbi:uncharacterized protein DUF4913 [Enteractinococcus coprophilus]|uniref:Uncharacterized protein DUF4913 n=2 Tax=Enteractinococcus coprophilus TaxID=1027633 RepID=A0A542ZXX5_9MICC|nr:uncharacterized protein DUF4913 [Enteractinococcus coprophilus]
MVDDMPTTLADAEAQPPASAPDAPQLQYASVFEFYDGIVEPFLRDRLIGPRHQRWSAQWWKSAEAMLRLNAVWRAYEALRLDAATGLSVWLKDHFDPHMRALTSEDGPFGDSRDASKRGEDPPYDRPEEILSAYSHVFG